MKKNISISPEVAWTLCQQGVFVGTAGYKWRFHRGQGQYLAYGKFPSNVRGCAPFTYKSFQRLSGNVLYARVNWSSSW